MTVIVRRLPDASALGRAGAALVTRKAVAAVAERGRFTLVLSGGSSPLPLYEQLARATDMPWSQTHLFWGDERWVPRTHADSNVGLVTRSLLSRVAVPPAHIHLPPIADEGPTASARRWQTELADFFRGHLAADGFPSFDLILLGVGADGHTASLFPGTHALRETSAWVAAIGEPVGDPRVPRLTLTLPVINRCRCVVFLVGGGGKEEVVRRILDEPDRWADRYPAARVRPAGEAHWLLQGDGGPGS